jgi:hypothetical protein
MKIFRLIMALMLIVSMMSLASLNLVGGDWKSFVLGCLYTTANIIIFIV